LNWKFLLNDTGTGLVWWLWVLVWWLVIIPFMFIGFDAFWYLGCSKD